MGYWKFIVPQAGQNLLTDPSFALADPDTEWTIAGDGAGVGFDFTRVETRAFYGWSCAESETGTAAFVRIFQSITNPTSPSTLSCYVRRSGGAVPTSSHVQAYFDNARADFDSITSVGSGWYRCVKSGNVANNPTQMGVVCHEDDINVDGVQFEDGSDWTTFIDGEQDGCRWDAGRYTSTSTRSAQSRAGGLVQDFEDDYNFEVVDWQGWGVPPHLLNLDNYALLPGAQMNNIKIHVNTLTLTGFFQGTSLQNLHSRRQQLVEELAHDRYPATDSGWQPIRIWYTGAAVHKEANVFYDSGLDGASMVGNAYTEKIPIRFLMADPMWYQLGNSTVELDSYDAATLRYLAARFVDTGQWDDMGLTADPANAGGQTGTIHAVLVASDGSVYFGGDYDGLNNDAAPADAGCDFICRYDPTTETFKVLVGASHVNDIVYDIVEGPDGTIYLCGAFTDVNGVVGDSWLISYDPAADTWAAVGAPDGAATVCTAAYAMAFDSDGNLYVVGNFTDWASAAPSALDYIAKWDGAAWSALGTPTAGTAAITAAYAIAIDADDNIYVGGDFDNWAGDVDADGIAVWNGTAWADLEGAALSGNKIVYDIAYDPTLGIYFAGDFINAGGEANADYVFLWNGTAVEALSTGLDDIARTVDVAPDGIVWVGGDFEQAGTLACYHIALWNGAAFVAQDVAEGDDIYAVDFGEPDPVVPQNYDIFYGKSGSSGRAIAGDALPNNGGTAHQYPVFLISRSGGTTALLVSIRNETTGKQLYFRYELLDGEELTIDCRPGKRSVTSSMFGRRPDIMRAASDFGSFTVQPGVNQITLLVYPSGGPTVEGYMMWRDAYRGMD